MHLMRLLHRCQQGFTTVTLMGTLVVGGLMVAATFAAVQPDIAFTQKDEDSKQAYAAAEAGLNYYLNRLGQDSSYYVKCDQVDQPNQNAVNLEWTGVDNPNDPNDDPRRWQTIPGSSAQYSIELLAVQNTSVAGTELCNPALPGAGMVDPTTGTFRIRATGRVRAPTTSNPNPFKRSIIATLRPKSFIDFLWFTDFETLPPFAYGNDPDPQWAAANCAKYRPFRPSSCADPDFITPDNLQGPVKTNDSISICGDPTFGRVDAGDLIELNQEDPGYEECSGSDPTFNGEVKWPAGVLPMPQSNAALETAADVGYVFTGETKIVLNGTSMTITTGVTSSDPNGTTVTRSFPQSGVVYVKNSTCVAAYARNQTYTYSTTGDPFEYMKTPGCGNVWVSGTYSNDLTIGADNDIVIMDDLKRSTSTPKALLGLVANNFVRVFHPITSGGFGSCVNDPDGPGEITIEAAMLALKQSFINDNWHSCPPTDTLHVFGAIAQKYRGTVGTHSGGTPQTGYAKDYQYNDELRYRQPPHFINPAELEWRVVRENEQVPAR